MVILSYLSPPLFCVQAKVFPFNGDLYLSIGTAVWRKDHLNGGNDAIADSVDDWPRTYQEGWFKVIVETLKQRLKPTAHILAGE